LLPRDVANGSLSGQLLRLTVNRCGDGAMIQPRTLTPARRTGKRWGRGKVTARPLLGSV
jgi:hypothetical protein